MVKANVFSVSTKCDVRSDVSELIIYYILKLNFQANVLTFFLFSKIKTKKREIKIDFFNKLFFIHLIINNI